VTTLPVAVIPQLGAGVNRPVLAPFGIQQRFCFSLCFFQFSFFGSDSVHAFFHFLYFCGLFRHRLRREWHLTVFTRSRNLLRRLNKVSR